MARATRNKIPKRRPRRQPSKFAAQPVHSLHDAALTLLDAAIETLKSALMKDIDKRRGKLQVRAFRLDDYVYRRSATHLAATVRARVVRQVVLTGKRSVTRSRKGAIAA